MKHQRIIIGVFSHFYSYNKSEDGDNDDGIIIAIVDYSRTWCYHNKPWCYHHRLSSQKIHFARF